jgi:hypothetical protein
MVEMVPSSMTARQLSFLILALIIVTWLALPYVVCGVWVVVDVVWGWLK